MFAKLSLWVKAMAAGLAVVVATLSVGYAEAIFSASRNDAYAAVLCFKTGERISGLNKICFYDCLGSAAAITIKSFELCPLTIRR